MVAGEQRGEVSKESPAPVAIRCCCALAVAVAAVVSEEEWYY